MTDDPVRVVVADDHPTFLAGVRSLLGTVPGIEVVAEADSGDAVVEVCRAQQPDVVLMDLHMPGVNGIDATRRIVAESPHIGVLVLTMFDDDSSVFAALRAGARGYLLKGADRDEIVRALHGIAGGEVIVGRRVATQVLAWFRTAGSQPARSPALAGLTQREVEVLELVAQGRSNAAIATALGMRPKTVRNHVSNIFAKLQVADRAEAIVRARRAGLGEPPAPPA